MPTTPWKTYTLSDVATAHAAVVSFVARGPALLKS
jgi:hypothetical protein